MPRRITPLIVLALAACSSNPIGGPTPPSEPSLQLSVIESSDHQQAVAGERLPLPLAVRATRGGVPVSGVPVSWSTGSGWLRRSAATTDVLGIARATWTLGSVHGPVEAVAVVSDEPTIVARFSAFGWERVIAERVGPASEDGLVADALTIRVRVHGFNDLLPRADIPVAWSGAGDVEPALSFTNSEGIAEARWRPGTVPGAFTARGTARGATGGAVTYHATLRSGPAATATITSAPDSVARNWAVPFTVRGLTTDAWGNPTGNAPVAWSVDGGGLAIVISDSLSGPDAVARATLVPTGQVDGVARLRMAIGNGSFVDEHAVAVLPPQYVIRLDMTLPGFRSLMNGTTPAVDTVPVGTTFRWWLSPFDYELHAIEVVGHPGGGTFPYGPTMVSATFTAPGTFQYRDTESGILGTVVVTP